MPTPYSLFFGSSLRINILGGYPFANKVAKEAVGRGLSIKDAIVEKGIMDQATAERMFDPMSMTDIVAFQALIDGYKKWRKTNWKKQLLSWRSEAITHPIFPRGREREKRRQSPGGLTGGTSTTGSVS